MNEIDNTIKYGLMAATTDVVIKILNETYPRADDAAAAAAVQEGEGGAIDGASVRLSRPRGNYKIFPSIKGGNEGEDAMDAQEGSSARKLLQQRDRNNHRHLVYYTDDNPVIITDVEDVVDQACPPGQNCMRVMSTVFVVLEPGDDPAELTEVVRLRIEGSFNDGSFFEVSMFYFLYHFVLYAS